MSEITPSHIPVEANTNEPPRGYGNIPDMSKFAGFIGDPSGGMLNPRAIENYLNSKDPRPKDEQNSPQPSLEFYQEATAYESDLNSNNNIPFEGEGLKRKLEAGHQFGMLPSGSSPCWAAKPTDKGTPLISRLANTMRVPLYRAGIWVTLRYPSRLNMYQFARTVNNNKFEFGRKVGAHHHYAMPYFMIEEFLNFLPTIIVDSNFKQYRDPKALKSILTYNDLHILLWACCCLIYPAGVHIGQLCIKCNDYETPFLNPTKMAFFDLDQIHSEAIKFMESSRNKELTIEEVKKYQQEMMSFTREETLTDDIKIVLAPPTLERFCTIMEDSVAWLTAELNSNSNTEIPTIMAGRVFRMLSPWIQKAIVNIPKVNEQGETENVWETFYDEKDIDDILNAPQIEPQVFTDKVHKFIQDSTLVYFLKKALRCPKCKDPINPEVDNHNLIDCLHLFFVMCCQRMITSI